MWAFLLEMNMATVFTDTPKIGVAIGETIAKEDLARAGHRAGSRVVASDGKDYEFEIDGGTGAGTWEEITDQ